jgi:uncharacterized PurR-regulated membrane protein YhhQ (DUF165 family)
MFKDINKSMLLKLVALHVIVIIVSNALVAVPVEIMGIKLTWAAFTFPLVVIATDLTVRLLGKSIARQTIAVAYPLAIIGSIAVVLAEGAPGSVALRIGFASATAYANLIDTYAFFAVAFNNSADEYMAANWVEIAGSQVVLKILLGLVIFLPAYGLLLRHLSSRIKVSASVQASFKNAGSDLTKK